MLKDIDSGAIYGAEMYPGRPFTMEGWPVGLFISFNGLGYDLPIMSLALAGADNVTLKRATNDIIQHDMKPWDIRDKYGGVRQDINHIDIMPVAVGQVGLKAYGGRMHSKRLQDLPYDPEHLIAPEEREVVRTYCANDLDTTIDLFNSLEQSLALRQRMSDKYGMDLRSKSNAQIAEAVIRSEVEKILGYKIQRTEFHPAYRFKYIVPAFVRFQTPGMQRFLEWVRKVEFGLDHNGHVVGPEELSLQIGAAVYTFGIGGLHSTEKCVSYVGDLISPDVTSYYPAVIRNQGLYPPAMGEVFLTVYGGIVDTRIAAKQVGDKDTAEDLKVVVNASFGKFGNRWSTLYSPNLMIQVTLTGQLAILMLIEQLECVGIAVVSANTDGLVVKLPPSRRAEYDAIVEEWSAATGCNLEESKWRALYAKDVNNYIAITEDGKLKQKGLYAKTTLSKNPTNRICVEAAIAYLTGGVGVSETIRACSDIRQFLTIRQVKGGASYQGNYLGKVVRWYYKLGAMEPLRYATNGNKVARSDGAQPCMELPHSIPLDLDHQWYINEANQILKNIGAI